jgi:hypothetical protein
MCSRLAGVMKLELVGSVGLLLVGCAGAAPAQHLRFADVAAHGAPVDWRRPIVLEFQPGDRLPVRFAFSDQVFELEPAAPPLALVAKRHCFVRIEAGRITSSLSGADFDEKPQAPGSFHVGLAITREGTWIDAAVATPRRASR